MLLVFFSDSCCYGFTTFSASQNDKLAPPSVTQAGMLNSQGAQGEPVASINILSTVLSIAEYLLGDSDSHVLPLPLKYLEPVISTELEGKLPGINLSKIDIQDGIVLIPYAEGKHNYIVQVAHAEAACIPLIRAGAG